MFSNKYYNFVRPVSHNHIEVKNQSLNRALLSGEEARKLYLEEIKEATKPSRGNIYHSTPQRTKTEEVHLSDKDLFITVQNNDVDTLEQILNKCPERIKTTDEYGWSLLMIACQANAIETVRQLLKHGVDTSIRDKAGNSAQSLVIKNNNYTLADILLSHRESEYLKSKNRGKETKAKSKEEFNCEICYKIFPDKEEHLSSTIHNISASKSKKLPTNYVIPSSNKGYQIMLKVGWDKESGLGRDGSGKKYPIKTIQKKDRLGLGHEKRKPEETNDDTAKHKNRKMLAKECQSNRKMEINFRREFY